jgi:hypothetical protein
MRTVYGFLPILMWTAFSFGGDTSGNQVYIASIPSSSKAFASASAASAIAGISSCGLDSPTITPTAVTFVPMDEPSDLVVEDHIAVEPLKSILLQPAASKALSISNARPKNSGSPGPTPISNSISENCRNSLAMRSICSSLRRLGARNFSNSNRASSALWFASAARAFASAARSRDAATFWSEILCRSAWRLERLDSKMISPPMANAKTISQRISHAVSCHFFGSTYHQSTTASNINVATTARAHQLSRQEYFSTARRSSVSWLSIFGLSGIGFLLLGRGRHYTPSGHERIIVRLLWLGLALLILVLAIVKYH